ncbi:MAG: biotin/lipoyl-binding protein [Planctomycetota bacterium]
MRRRLPHILVLIVLTAALVGACGGLLGFVRVDRLVIAKGRLAGGSVPVRSPWEGRIAEVLVTAGAEVTPGAALMRLDTAALEAQSQGYAARIRGLEDQARTLQAEKERLVGVEYPAERQEALLEIERARLQLSRAETQERVARQLGSEGLSPQLSVEDAVLARQLAELGLQEAEQALPRLESRHQASLDSIDAELRGLSTRLAGESAAHAEVLERLEAATVRAPVAGIVLGEELRELKDRAVPAGGDLCRIATGPAERFEGSIADTGRPLTRPGLGVRIRIEGYPWLVHGTLLGQVEAVSERREQDAGFPVQISVEPAAAPGRLYEGMRAEARIVIEEKVSLARLLVEKLAGTEAP